MEGETVADSNRNVIRVILGLKTYEIFNLKNKYIQKEPHEHRTDNDEIIEMGGSGLRRNDSNLSISSKMVSS